MKTRKAKAKPVEQIAFADAVVMGKKLATAIESNIMKLGELAERVTPDYGPKTIAKLAAAIGVHAATLKRYRSTYRKYKDVDFGDSTPSSAALTALEGVPGGEKILKKNPKMKGPEARKIAQEYRANGQPSPAPRNTAGWLRTAVKLGVEAIQLFGHLDEGEPLTAEIVRAALADPDQGIARMLEGAKALSNLVDKLKAALAAPEQQAAA